MCISIVFNTCMVSSTQNNLIHYTSSPPQLARALTLRTLGWMSGVVGENRRVQHLIREALDAKESVELQAAIMAAEKYAAKSKLACEIHTHS